MCTSRLCICTQLSTEFEQYLFAHTPLSEVRTRVCVCSPCSVVFYCVWLCVCVCLHAYGEVCGWFWPANPTQGVLIVWCRLHLVWLVSLCHERQPTYSCHMGESKGLELANEHWMIPLSCHVCSHTYRITVSARTSTVRKEVHSIRSFCCLINEQPCSHLSLRVCCKPSVCVCCKPSCPSQSRSHTTITSMIPLASFLGDLALNSTEAETPDGPGLTRILGTIKMHRLSSKRWRGWLSYRIP